MTILLHVNGSFIIGIFVTAIVLYMSGFYTALFLVLKNDKKKEKRH